MPTFQDVLTKLWPQGNSKIPGLIEGIAAAAPTVFPRYGLTSNLTIAHAMAQFSHECGAGLEMVENLNYSAERLPEVWPKHFNSSNADQYAHNPQKLANFVYEPPIHNDLGNKPDSDDGWNFRGRGLSQVTGRDGYGKLAAEAGLDLLNHPEFLSDPSHALECGVADFILCGCLPYAKADDVTKVTLKLNGGTVGLAERRAWLTKWKAALENVEVVTAPVSIPAAKLSPVQPKHAVAAGSGATAGVAAHQAGLPWWAVALIVVAVAGVAYLVAHQLLKGKQP